jgi:hypothetical protein
LTKRIQVLEKELAARGPRRFAEPATALRKELAALAKKHKVAIQFTALEVASGQRVAARCRCICFA